MNYTVLIGESEYELLADSAEEASKLALLRFLDRLRVIVEEDGDEVFYSSASRVLLEELKDYEC